MTMLFEVLTYRRYCNERVETSVLDDLEDLRLKGFITQLRVVSRLVRSFQVAAKDITLVERLLQRKDLWYRKGGGF